MNNLITRTLSGAVFVAVVIAAILLPNPHFFGIVFLAMTILGLREFYLLCKHIEGIEPAWVLATVGGVAAFLCAYCCCVSIDEKVSANVGNHPYAFLVLYIPFISALFMVELFRKRAFPIHNVAISLMGHFYVALPFCCMCAMKKMGAVYLLAFFILIWASDTGAYLVGRCIGKHKMFERVSPKKTWEGIGGGLLFALLFGWLFAQFASEIPALGYTAGAFATWKWMTFAVLVFVSGALGDLVESLFKRYLQIKDSGKFLPGHGGVLDRLDSALIAAPIAFSFLAIAL